MVAGVFFVVAAVAAIAAKLLWQPVLGNPDYVLGTGADTGVLLGGLLEFVTAVSVLGTGVALYPVVKRQNEGVALGYALGRVLEGATIVAGLATVMAVVALRRGNTGSTDDGTLVAAQESLVALHDAMFLLGPGLIIGVNTLLLAYLMYRSRLVPRWIAVIGLVGGPLVFVSSTAVLFGAYEQVSAFAGLGAFPVFAWEMSLAVYLIAKGFKPSPVDGRTAPPQAVLSPA
ncbi:protein of unknown function [Blastococcus mobilis]|uniref:DUF4386 domain-containing protein n=1 Tax=Blastococcus mobilis TaxID=1938746 RepID=A0A238XR36_9ACTN|nr:protein of unknown function [Blastococcus mobilis]